MLAFFNTVWSDIPTVWIDTETTGIRAGFDRAVQFGLARFEKGVCVSCDSQLVDPGMPIPAEATAIHGVTDAMVASMPSIEEVFRGQLVQRVIAGAQPAAYNAPFDRHFVPPFGEDWTWPWLDCLSIVRVIDRFERGKGRHRLELAAARHGVTHSKAHDAGSDARAAGELFYKLAPAFFGGGRTLGEALHMQRRAEADEWSRFMGWLSRQPPREVQP